MHCELIWLSLALWMGDKGAKELLMIVADEDDGRLPVEARASLALLAAQLNALQMLIGSLEKQIKMQHRANPASQRLETIPLWRSLGNIPGSPSSWRGAPSR